MYDAAEVPKIKEHLSELIGKAEDCKWKYCKKSKDEIREEFYVNGVPIEYKHTDRKTGET